MRIGIPKEIKTGETRVAVSPDGVRALRRAGHQVFVQKGAGVLTGWSDAAYRKAGATILRTMHEVFRRADLICKVKEPQLQEIPLLRPGQILFTYLHLASSPQLIHALQRTKCVAIGYETIELVDGRLPLLEPMSDVAGRVAMLMGVGFLRSDHGGKGILLASPDSRYRGTVGILGCGHVGRAAMEVALALGANVYVVDRSPQKRAALRRRYGKRLKTFASNPKNIAAVAKASDILVGAVLLTGQRTPHLVTTAMVKRMEPGSVIIDVAIDQGGCVATSRVTPIDRPYFTKYGVIHSAIPNLPALAPRTASQLLSKRVLPYLKKLANNGWEKATRRNPALAKGLNVVMGEIVYPGLV